MQLEPFLLSYAAFASIALTTQRIRRNILSSNLPGTGALRLLAAVLLSLAAWRAVEHFGPEKGWAALVGLMSLSAVPLILLLSRWPRAGVSAGAVAGILGLGVTLFELAS